VTAPRSYISLLCSLGVEFNGFAVIFLDTATILIHDTELTLRGCTSLLCGLGVPFNGFTVILFYHRDQFLQERIAMIFTDSRQTYGSPRIHAALKAQGEQVGRKRVARLMRENHFIAKKRQRFKTTTRVDKRLSIVENLLRQDFTAVRPNEKWVSDITCVWTALGWLYVAVILDLFSRKVIGLSMSERQTKDLVIKGLKQAVTHREKPGTLIYHSDRGSQYTSHDFQKLLKAHGMTPSMSGTGNCYDNAAMESFFATLKGECTFFENYEDREKAKNSIFDYCFIFYNQQRIHSTLGYVCPKEFEQRALLVEKNVL